MRSPRRRHRMATAVLVLLLATASPGLAHRKSTGPTGPEYAVALATANRFLHAWQSNDLANGIALLSDGVRRAQNAGEFERFFSAGTDRAFEIHAGHGNRGRYSFPVVLVTLTPVSGSTRRMLSMRSGEIRLVSAGKDDWVVDKLP